MNDQATIAKLKQLPVDERLRLMEDVWSSLSETPEELAIPTWHRDELEQRIAAHRDDPAVAKSWLDIKAEILHSLGK